MCWIWLSIGRGDCASMKKPGRDFRCGVKDGKIYVFVGFSLGLSLLESNMRASEVCDPKLDAWSSIKPMKHKQNGQRVTVFQEEMLVYGGAVDPEFDSEYDASYDDPDTSPSEERGALFLEVYHPGKDEWRLVKPFMDMYDKRLFTAQGKLYLISSTGISVRNADLNSFSFDIVGSNVPQFMSMLFML